jgi:sugar lactone lactonase YvrE
VIAGDPAATTGSHDGVGAKAVIQTPRGLAVDTKGNLYAADTDEGIIRKITPDGTVTTLAGKLNDAGLADGKGAEAQFAGPRGLAMDKDGNIYVADSDNAAIRKITPDGTVTTVFPPKK